MIYCRYVGQLGYLPSVNDQATAVSTTSEGVLIEVLCLSRGAEYSILRKVPQEVLQLVLKTRVSG